MGTPPSVDGRAGQRLQPGRRLERMDEHEHNDIRPERETVLQAQARVHQRIKAAIQDPDLAQKLPLACEIVRETWRAGGPHDPAHPERSWTDPRGLDAACRS